MNRLVCLLALLCLAAPMPVLAARDASDSSGADLWVIRTSTDGSGLLLSEGAARGKVWDYHLQLGAIYAGGPLLALSGADGRQTPIVGDRAAFLLRAGIYLREYLEVGFGLPLYLQGSGLSASGSPEGFGAGDLTIDLKFALLDTKTRPVGVAVVQTFYLPTSHGEGFRGNSRPGFRTIGVVDSQLGPVYLTLNVGYRSQRAYLAYDARELLLEPVPAGAPAPEPGSYTDPILQLKDSFILGGGLAYATPLDGLRLFGELHASSEALTIFQRARTTPVTALIGAGYDLDCLLRFELAGGAGLTDAPGTPRWLVAGRIIFDGGRPCCSAAAAPHPPADRDGDGIPDGTDACPDQAETKNGVADDDGCPDVLDKDGDGIPDETDKCPDLAETKNGVADDDGCPDVLDKDGDGIPDGTDKCPDQAETKNGVADDDGCPDAVYKAVVVTKGKIELGDRVYFTPGKAVIEARSHTLLDEVARALKDNPEVRVRIEGHTDNQGGPKTNRALSLKRAEAVKAYLVGTGGIDAGRLEPAGFGPDRPLADNTTPEGREQNRRVEFVIIQP